MQEIHQAIFDIYSQLSPDQWLVLLALILGAGILSHFSASLVQRVIHRFFQRVNFNLYSSDDVNALSLLRPIQMMVLGWVMVLGLTLFSITGPVLTLFFEVAKILTYLAIVWGGFRVADLTLIYLSEKAAETETKFDDLLAPLIARTIKLFCIGFGAISIAEILKLPLASLVTGLGIGGLAIAMAAKDTISNVFGSLSVIADRPFNIGDWVKVNDVEGTVEKLGFRSTRIRTFYNSLVSVPNNILLTATVDNMGEREFRRYKTSISVTYSTSAEKIEAFLNGIRQLINEHPKTRKDYFHVNLNEFAPSSLDILLYCFFKVSDWGEELQARESLMLSIIKLANEQQIDFAFPSQSLYIENDAKLK